MPRMLYLCHISDIISLLLLSDLGFQFWDLHTDPARIPVLENPALNNKIILL